MDIVVAKKKRVLLAETELVAKRKQAEQQQGGGWWDRLKDFVQRRTCRRVSWAFVDMYCIVCS